MEKDFVVKMGIRLKKPGRGGQSDKFQVRTGEGLVH